MIYGSKNLADKCNLVKPNDFYSLVAEEWSLEEYDLTSAQKRKIIKKIVMPRSYGAGRQTISEDLAELPFLQHLNLDEDQLISLADEGIAVLEESAPELREFKREVGRIIRGLHLQPDESVD